MYAHERRRKIAEILHSSPFQSVEQLAANLAVSVATIRRDLTHLARQNAITRVHGGAVSLLHERFSPAPATPAEEEDVSNLVAAAFKLVADGETIALDSGILCEKLAALLPSRAELTVLACSTAAAWNLRNAWHLRVLCLGGEMLNAACVNRGSFALQMIEQIYFDKIFLDVQGIDPERGLTIDEPAEAGIKQSLIKQSKEVVVMAAHSRIGHVAPVKIGEASQAQRIIAHSSASTADPLEKLQKLGVKLTWV